MSLVILLAIVLAYVPQPRAAPLPMPPVADDIHVKIMEFKGMLSRQTDKEKIKKAIEIDRKSKEAFDSGNPALTLKLISAGIAYLKGNDAANAVNIDALINAAGAAADAPLSGRFNHLYADSPFGILGPYEYWMASPEVASKEAINTMLLDLGAKWVAELPFELKNLPRDINIYTRVGTFPGLFPPNIDYDRYIPLLKNQVASFKDRVKYYEIDTEPLGKFSGWDGNAVKYAVFLKRSYGVIKSVCPECYVVLGGLPGAGVAASPSDANSRFLHEILKDGASSGKLFDVFAFKQHFHGLKDYRIIKSRLDVYRKILSDYGVNIDKMPVFLETALYDGTPRAREFTLPPQTETDQAIGVVKTYVYAISIGITRVYWNGVMELYKFGGNPYDPFNFYALVNNKKNDGNSHKKLAYYTYKKMVETLEGSNWKLTETIRDSDGVFICRFLKGGRHIWVVWSDNQQATPVTLNLAAASKVNITMSVPKVFSGKQIADYDSAFVTTAAATDDTGDLTIRAASVPVYIEEAQ
ncbi:MAG: hypothetical protein HQK97_07605 [Nitrospirae bacterium]|nr:hypothetical protein [Nitrospirota bacterium]